MANPEARIKQAIGLMMVLHVATIALAVALCATTSPWVGAASAVPLAVLHARVFVALLPRFLP